MASIHISGLDEVMIMMDKLSNNSLLVGAAKEVVDASIPELENALKAATASAADGHGNNPGELVESIHTLPAKENSLGVFGVARPDGVDSDGNLMEDRFRWLDRGVHRKGDWQSTGKGIRDKAIGSVQGSLEAKMTELMEAKIGEIAD